MADLSITATSVLKGTNAVVSTVTSNVFGETMTAGQSAYRKAADQKIYKAKADTTADATCIGVVLNGGAVNQPCVFQSAGTITIGATTAAGTIYCVSGANFGGIAPWADLSAGQYVTIIGVGDGAGGIVMGINVTGVAHA